MMLLIFPFYNYNVFKITYYYYKSWQIPTKKIIELDGDTKESAREKENDKGMEIKGRESKGGLTK